MQVPWIILSHDILTGKMFGYIHGYTDFGVSIHGGWDGI